MKYIDLTLPTPAENLACDEALLDLCESGEAGELLRFWEPQTPFVVLGYANRAASEVNLPACEAAKIGVFRRFSGGGTVLQGPGCLNYSVILRIPGPDSPTNPLRRITGTNQFVMRCHQQALQPLLKAAVEVHGHTDLALLMTSETSPLPLKFSGNAQRRKRNFLIFHGTFLLDFDLALVEKYLRPPSQQPVYRKNRSHQEFLTNLNLDADLIKQTLRHAWSAGEPFADIPTDSIGQLARRKYSSPEWSLKL